MPALESDPMSPRQKMVRAAQEVLNKRGDALESSAQVLEAILERSGLAPALGWRPAAGIDGLVKLARKRHAYFGQGRIKAGDIVLFHNTHDLNKNGLDDDWYSLASVAIEGRGHRTVTVGSTGRGPRSIFLEPEDPHRRRLEGGQVVNSFLRTPSRTDSPHQAYLAGELYAGFIDLEDCLGR